MIPKRDEVAVYSNSTNDKAFTINASKEAFRILSSGIYSNKIQAIIRELSCNAYDSHVMAGKEDVPFFVHMPDKWEPFFSVEDFGIGLDDEDIENIYTTYFASTKNDSNDTIGGLGLGSKSPYSYTETFTVRARKDGVERVYNAFISAAGMPSVSMMTETDTDEPNGVLVTVPVRDQDFYNFMTEGRNVYRYFKTVPNFNVSDYIINNSIVTQMNDQGIIINRNGNSGNVLVLMGNVGYNVQVTDTLIPRSNQKIWSFLEKTSLTIRFNIGDLSVAASRETISFDDESKTIFIAKLDNIIHNYYQQYQDHIDQNIKTVGRALQYIRAEFAEWAWTVFEFEGRSLFDYSEENALLGLADILDPKVTLVDIGQYKVLKTSGGNQITTNTLRDKLTGTFSIKHKSMAGRNIGLIMDDTTHGRGLETTARQHIRDYDNKINTLFVVPYVLSDDQIQQVADLLGENYVSAVKLSEVKEKFKVIRDRKKPPKEERAPVVRAKKVEIRIDYWKAAEPFVRYKEILNLADLDGKRTAIMVIERNTIVQGPKILEWAVTEFNTTALVAYTKLYELDYIIIVRASELERVTKKIPDAIMLSDLGPKDVLNHEVGFLFFFASVMGRSLSNCHFYMYGRESTPKTEEQSREYLVNEVIRKEFESSLYRHNAIANMIPGLGYLNIPSRNFDFDTSDLYNKIADAFTFFTEKEIMVCSNNLQYSKSSFYYKAFEQYKEAKIEALLNESKRIMETYPLLEHWKFDIDKPSDFYTNSLKKWNDYIEAIDYKNESEKYVDKKVA